MMYVLVWTSSQVGSVGRRPRFKFFFDFEDFFVVFLRVSVYYSHSVSVHTVFTTSSGEVLEHYKQGSKPHLPHSGQGCQG